VKKNLNLTYIDFQYILINPRNKCQSSLAKDRIARMNLPDGSMKLTIWLQFAIICLVRDPHLTQCVIRHHKISVACLYKKFKIMPTRRAKAYSSSGLVV